MNESDEKKYLIGILALLIVMNILFRIPVTPHEKGSDSFLIHSMANSVSNEGFIKWNINPLSILGLYPLSYSTGAIISLSEISLMTGLDMEYTILAASMILGIISALSAFVLAKEFSDNLAFRFFAAFSFSLSHTFLAMSQWGTSTRVWFVALLPIFVWTIIRFVNTKKARYVILSAIMFLTLATIHRIFLFNIAIIITAIAAYILHMLSKKYPEKFTSTRISTVFSVMLAATIALGLIIVKNFRVASYKLEQLTYFGNIALLDDNILLKILQHNLLAIGTMALFIIPGVIFLFLKKDKTYPEYWISLTIIFFGLLISEVQYSLIYSLSFLALLSAYGVIGIASLIKKKSEVISGLFMVLVAVGAFAILAILLLHDSPSESVRGEESWAREDIYHAALFFKTIDTDKAIAFNEIVRTPSIFSAYSQKRYAVPTENDYLIYMDLETADIEVSLKSSKSYLDDFRNPFKLKSPDIYRDRVDILYYNIANPRVKDIMEQYDIGYFLENQLTNGKYVVAGYIGNSRFIQSIYNSENKIYDNNRHALWQIDQE